MLSKKMKSILAIALCGIMAIVAIPMLPAKADDTTTTVYTDCADCADYKMSESFIYPNTEEAANSLTSVWYRTLTNTEDGMRLTFAQVNNNYHSTRTKYAVDGAHMRLTFHVPADANDTANTCDTSKTVGLTIGNSNMNNNGNQGLGFKIQVATGQLYCYVDGTSIDHSGYEGYNGNVAKDRIFIPENKFDRSATTLDIKTSIDGDGNFVLNLNGYEFTVAKTVWESSNYDGDEVRFKVGQQGKLLDCTWNFIHGKEAICYNQVTEVNALIASGKIIQARKAYLTLSENEQACVANKEALSDLDDLDDYKMSESLVYPNTTEAANSLTSVWYRTLTNTEDGMRLTFAQVNNNYHSTRTKYAVDGAHMRLTFHVPADANDTANTCDASKTVGLTIGNSNMNNNGNQGLGFKIQVATGQLYCYVDGTPIDHSGYEGYNGNVAKDRIFIPENKFDRSATTLDIKTSIDADGNFVLNLNGYEFTVAKTVWESSNYDGDEVRFKVGQQGKLLDCTWNFIHGGTDICCESLTDVEAKIDLCHPTTPIKANVEAARNAYNALADELKAIVINYDKLTTAETNAVKVSGTDFYNYGITENKFLSSSSWSSLIAQTQLADGWNIRYSSAIGLAYNVRSSEAIALDGAHVGVTMAHDGSTDRVQLTISNTSGNADANYLYIKLDTRAKASYGGGFFYLYCHGVKEIDTTNFPDNFSTTNNRVVFPANDNNEMDIRFDVDAFGNVYVSVNGSYIMVSATQLSTLGLDVTKPVYVGIAPDGLNPNVTVNYIVSGDVTSYDEVTGDTNGDDTMNVLDLARMKNNEEKDIKDILYYRTSSDLDKDGNSCDAEDLDLLRKELVK